MQNIYVKFSWENDPESVYVYGEKPDNIDFYNSKISVLNQKLDIEVGYKVSELAQSLERYKILAALLILITLLLWILVYFFNRRHRQYLVMKDSVLSKNRIIASLTHDLANPLQLLSLGILLIENYELKEKGFASIKTAFQKISEMLDFARLVHADEGELKSLELSSENASQLINDSIVVLEAKASKKNIELVNNIDADLYIKTHAACFVNHVMCNIINNAIKFSEAGSKVVFSSSIEGPYKVIEIKDCGTGISQESLDKIMLTSTVSSVVQKGIDGEKGLGLGLRQVNFFIQLFKARLEIKSTPKEQLISKDFPSTVIRLIF